MNREQIAKVISRHREAYDSDCQCFLGCECGWDNDSVSDNNGYAEHLADEILSIPDLGVETR